MAYASAIDEATIINLVKSKFKTEPGIIKINNDTAIIKENKELRFLTTKDADDFLTNVWGNPRSSPENLKSLVGLILPKPSIFGGLPDWGIEVTYNPTGYINDLDAQSLDAAQLYKKLEVEYLEGSKWRVSQGHNAVKLIGWVREPYYDEKQHALYWAVRAKFDGSKSDTLHYFVKVLGRKGVFVLTFIADIRSLDQINAQLSSVNKMIEFKKGFRYEDVNLKTDKSSGSVSGLITNGELTGDSELSKFNRFLNFLSRNIIPWLIALVLIGIAAFAEA